MRTDHPMTPEAARAAVEALSLLPFFPMNNQPAVRILSDMVFTMCPSIEACEWLVRRVMALWSKWEGPRELRAVLCSKYKPADGGEDPIWTDLYPEGVFSESGAYSDFPALPPGRLRQLLAAADVELPAPVERTERTAPVSAAAVAPPLPLRLGCRKRLAALGFERITTDHFTNSAWEIHSAFSESKYSWIVVARGGGAAARSFQSLSDALDAVEQS